jgi:type II secretory pathway pseudopilin PulG
VRRATGYKRTGIPKPPARVRGVTLVEILIAMGLSLGVLSAVGYAYIDQRITQRKLEQLALVQGSARLALERIGQDIRQAGFIGCNSALQRHPDKLVTETAVIPLYAAAATPAGSDNVTIDAENALRAFDASEPATVWGGSVPAGAVAGTAVIEVRYASSDGASRLSGPVAPDGMLVPTMGRFHPSRSDSDPSNTNRLGLLTDCQSAMVVDVANATDGMSQINPSLPIDFSRCGHASRVGSECFYWPTTTLMSLRVVQYYVADLGTAAQPDLRLMARSRVMSSGPVVWDLSQTIAQGVRDLRIIGAGLDTAFPNDVLWRAERFVDELVNGPDPVIALPAAEWSRIVRLDLRLSMQASSPAGTPATARAPIRNFEGSYTVRARVHPDPT